MTMVVVIVAAVVGNALFALGVVAGFFVGRLGETDARDDDDVDGAPEHPMRNFRG